MSSVDVIRKIGELPFDDDDMKAKVLSAAINEDLSQVVEALFEVDKVLLVKTLQTHTAGGLKLGAENEYKLEPCTLSRSERLKLVEDTKPRAEQALQELQKEIMRIGMERDKLEPNCPEDNKLEEAMESLFEDAENARKLAAMLDIPKGQHFSATFWDTISSEKDPLKNLNLIALLNVWQEGDEPEEIQRPSDDPSTEQEGK
eukprot:TRINITY_DN38176_c0_g1_i1.p1 TRINITY_DN38176_c0_g1~~TRINITY_DN38176_c0_g1_i1.p1  ORF type:complete len:202 (+),score=44.65 TRINITY_DN38176_c0_g1_i1:59-664(+)